MSQMKLPRRSAVVAVWAGAGVLGAAVVTGVASAASTAPAPSGPSAGSPAPQGHQPAKGHRSDGAGPGHLLHGQSVVQTRAGLRTVDVQRGDITAVDATSITIKSPDGFVGSYSVTAETKVRKDGATVAITTLKVGDKAGVRALEADGKKTARAVIERTPGVAPARPGASRHSGPAAGATTQSSDVGDSGTGAGELSG